MSEPDKKDEKLAEGTLISHLLELRDRVVKAFVAVLVMFVPSFYFRNDIFRLLSEPLRAKLKEGDSLIATGVTHSFTTPLKLAFFTALLAAMPYVLYQIWAFVAPGLYRKEKHFAMPLLVSAIVLFYVGTAFSYFFVFPVAFEFFISVTPEGVQNLPTIHEYVSIALTFFFAFGLAFEVPVVVVLLAVTGMVSVQKLSAARGYVIIGIFVMAAILTPPDPLSQILMAIPMWLLYEAGIIMARVLRRRRADPPPADAT